MIASDDDWGLQLAARDHFVEGEAGEMSLAQAKPAYARRKPLKRDALVRHVEPAMKVRVRGKQFLYLAIGLVDVLGIAGERNPAKRSFAFTEQRANVRRNKARKVERVRNTFVACDLANVVAVIERRDT